MILERVYDSTKVWFFFSYLAQGVASTVAIFCPICHNSYTGVDLIKAAGLSMKVETNISR